MVKRATRACSECHHRQYYRKKTDDWRCDRCGFTSNGSQIEEKKKYVLIPAEEVPIKGDSLFRKTIIKTIEAFRLSDHQVSYIQFNDLAEMKRVDSSFKAIVVKHAIDIKVIRNSELLRIYLEKL